MTKLDLLDFLARANNAEAQELAAHFRISYPAAAMALLRLLRQGLVARYRDQHEGLYWYELTQRGLARLRYFQRQ